jgi:uncharacterized membrane protein SpoIIM required for sporulation/uncharacterized RDD family membrane protein YckC
MRETTRIATPDSVELEFRLAGPGSRFLALAIDTAIGGVLYAALVALAIAAGLSLDGIEGRSTWAAGFLVFAFFLVRWGYYLFFEIRLRGQTPGKRALGIRVVREGGLPLGARHSLIRNLLRVVDSLPPPLCIVGAVSILATRKGQRLGDLAAGTVVIRERFRRAGETAAESDHAAGWVSRLEQGRSRAMVLLPHGQVDMAQVALIEEYFRRCPRLDDRQRAALSWQIALPLLPLFDKSPGEWEPAPGRLALCESLLQEVLSLARQAAAQAQFAAPVRQTEPQETPRESSEAAAKARRWEGFAQRTESLLRGGLRAVRRLPPAALRELLVGHRSITADLARAQSMGADPGTVERLNRMAIGGHVLIYGHAKTARRTRGWGWITAFPRAVRADAWAIALSALIFFCPALISSIAVRLDASVAYDLVGPEFYDFHPASDASLHAFPQLMRPVVASSVMTNNLQVAIFAFAFGLSAGIGTAYLLVMNGIHLGSVIGWLGMQGQARSLWGWVMPHGGTEILAIIIAGASGFLIAKGMLCPGQLKRTAALRVNAGRALALELGSMAMLVVAGIIEGFVSPSALGYAPRMVFASVMIVLWVCFFGWVGARPTPLLPADLNPPGR